MYGWPEHSIELWGVYLPPPSGPSVGTARHRQTAVELLVCSRSLIKLTVPPAPGKT